MMKSLVWPGILVLVSFAISCDSGNFAYKSSFSDGCWNLTDTLDVELEKTAEESFQIYLDMNQDYAYQNLYLKVYLQNPQGSTQEIMLNDTMFAPSGEWLIPKNSNRARVAYADPISLQGPKGNYRFRLIQFMREEKLCGIEGMGISLVE